jgi:hypothetical protein
MITRSSFMSLLSLACSLLFSLGLRLRGRHALFPPRGEEKKEEVKPERHAARTLADDRLGG